MKRGKLRIRNVRRFTKVSETVATIDLRDLIIANFQKTCLHAEMHGQALFDRSDYAKLIIFC